MNEQVFGKLTLLSTASGRRKTALCRCVCGVEKVIRYDRLISNRTKSCGCSRNPAKPKRPAQPVERHGLSGTPVHSVWAHLVKSGVTTGHPWRKFRGFLADMGNPSEPSRLAKLDGAEGYTKENCLWVPKTVSKSEFLAKYPVTNRKTHGLPIVCNGISKSVAEWARYFGMTYGALYYRLYIGKDSRLTAAEVISLVMKELTCTT